MSFSVSSSYCQCHSYNNRNNNRDEWTSGRKCSTPYRPALVPIETGPLYLCCYGRDQVNNLSRHVVEGDLQSNTMNAILTIERTPTK